MATIIMINRNSSVIIKNHEKKGNKKGSAIDGDNSDDDEETDNNGEKNIDLNNEPSSKDSNTLKQESCERKGSNTGGILVKCNANETIYLDEIKKTDTAKENRISSTNHAVASMITPRLNLRQTCTPDIVQQTKNPNMSEKDVKNIPRVRRKLPNIDSQ